MERSCLISKKVGCNVDSGAIQSGYCCIFTTLRECAHVVKQNFLPWHYFDLSPLFLTTNQMAPSDRSSVHYNPIVMILGECNKIFKHGPFKATVYLSTTA